MTAFNNEKYKDLQKQEINKRIANFGKLYIEVGGKLFDDKHASRVLPGFESDVKMQIFSDLKDDLQIIFCINARDIVAGKYRGDNNLSYGDETLRLVGEMKKLGIMCNDIMINFYEDNSKVKDFEEKCKKAGVKTYRSYYIEGYPHKVDTILSENGFGKNDYIKTHKNLILVSAPGANSGKLQTCLSQMFKDKEKGINAGYAKYETFPVWNLPLNHLTNVAYEMATVDMLDKNKIDPYHKRARHIKSVNYNRDIESYPIVNEILTKICGKQIYASPTEMGVNNVGFAIENDFEVQTASLKEIERRHLKHVKMFEEGSLNKKCLKRSRKLLKKSQKLYKKLKK